MGQTCTPKEWDHCRVEKMGCPGCYYDNNASKKDSTSLKIRAEEVKLRYDGELKIPEYEEQPCIPDDCNTHFCLHCGKGIPSYCENCYQMIILKNSSLQLQLNCSFPKNTVLEFLDAMRSILINGERPELQINELSKLYIQYGEEFTKNG